MVPNVRFQPGVCTCSELRLRIQSHVRLDRRTAWSDMEVTQPPVVASVR